MIEKAKFALGVFFPASYKKFLSNFGCGSIKGVEICRLIDSDFVNSSVPDAVWVTFEQQKLGLPKKLVVIYSTGYGPFYAIDTNKINDAGESPVNSYLGENKLEKVADSFAEFLLNELESIE